MFSNMIFCFLFQAWFSFQVQFILRRPVLRTPTSSPFPTASGGPLSQWPRSATVTWRMFLFGIAAPQLNLHAEQVRSRSSKTCQDLSSFASENVLPHINNFYYYILTTSCIQCIIFRAAGTYFRDLGTTGPHQIFLSDPFNPISIKLQIMPNQIGLSPPRFLTFRRLCL